MTLARFALAVLLAGVACASSEARSPDHCRYTSEGVQDTASGIPVLTLRAVCPRPTPKYVEAATSARTVPN